MVFLVLFLMQDFKSKEDKSDVFNYLFFFYKS